MQSGVGAFTLKSIAPSGPREDWSEVEALLQVPSVAPAAPSVPARVLRLKRSTFGFAAALALSGCGLVAATVATTPRCHGDGCSARLAQQETPSDRPAPVTAGGAPVRVVSMDAGLSPIDEVPSREGRSVAEPLPAHRDEVRQRSSHPPASLAPIRARARRIPVSAAPAPVVARNVPQRPRAFALAPVVEHARAPALVRATPRTLTAVAVRPPIRGGVKPHVVVGGPRLERIWISPNEWILVRAR